MEFMSFDKKFNLMYLITSLDIGGAQKAMLRILSQLDKRKYNITVVCLWLRTGLLLSQLQREGIKTIDLATSGKWDVSVISRFINVLHQERPRLLFCSLFHATLIGRLLGRAIGVPFVINWEHSAYLGRYHRRLLNRLTAPLSDAIIADSDATRTSIISQLKVPTSKVFVIPIGGVNIHEYNVYTRQKTASDDLVIGSVGMLYKVKGYQFLIKAAKRIIQEFPNVTFQIAGDGPEKSNLEMLALSEKVADSIQFIGYQEDIPDFLSKMDIYVQPSLYEGQCITVIEAMAAGRPVVASSVGGIVESVVDKETGFTIAPGDTDALVDRIATLIENPSLRKKLGQKGRQRVQKHFTLEIMTQRIEELINSIVTDCSLSNK